MASDLQAAAAPVVRKARTSDAPAIQKLVNGFAERDLMLPRSLSQLYENIRDFYVADLDGDVVGCVGLHVTWKDLAEVKSLAVAEQAQGHGLARTLVSRCIAEAGELGIERVFALTYVPGFFEKMGFGRTDRANLPRKVWTECVFCPKFNCCTEVAVVWPAGE